MYAIRLGAEPIHLSLIASLPALILLLSSGIGARWTRRFADPTRALLLPSFLNRSMFLLPAFAPFFPPELRPLWLIAAVTLPALTQGAAAIAFVVMLRSAVPETQLTGLLSQRGIWLNVSIGVSALVLGVWLEHTPFPLGYQIMFVLAYVFAIISLRECSRVRVLSQQIAAAEVKRPTGTFPIPARVEANPWRAPNFMRVAVVAFVIHVAYLAINPLIPEYLVDRFNATEGFIALFSMVELAGGALIGILAPRIAQRFGNRGMIALSMLVLALAALSTAVAPTLYVTLIGAALTGAAWTTAAIVGLFAFYSENTPSEHMTRYSTAYHQVIGLAMFVGPLIGGVLASAGISLVALLLVGAVLRVIAAPLVDPSLFARLWHVAPTPNEEPLPAGLSIKL